MKASSHLLLQAVVRQTIDVDHTLPTYLRSRYFNLGGFMAHPTRHTGEVCHFPWLGSAPFPCSTNAQFPGIVLHIRKAYPSRIGLEECALQPLCVTQECWLGLVKQGPLLAKGGSNQPRGYVATFYSYIARPSFPFPSLVKTITYSSGAVCCDSTVQAYSASSANSSTQGTLQFARQIPKCSQDHSSLRHGSSYSYCTTRYVTCHTTVVVYSIYTINVLRRATELQSALESILGMFCGMISIETQSKGYLHISHRLKKLGLRLNIARLPTPAPAKSQWDPAPCSLSNRGSRKTSALSPRQFSRSPTLDSLRMIIAPSRRTVQEAVASSTVSHKRRIKLLTTIATRQVSKPSAERDWVEDGQTERDLRLSFRAMVSGQGAEKECENVVS
ncbi:hypothetical protein ACRALDRAFT_205485 [Sodiomyces alcalophilus JCM 7366]|uniref:uncharacterized protein n=1 Tax=Sodiomyces alcalophilus JCM 7366 TaxID=591952 RepID=UPI0039B5F31D